MSYHLSPSLIVRQGLNDQLGPALEEKRASIAKIETLEAELETRNTEIKHHRLRIQKLLDKYQVFDQTRVSRSSLFTP